MDGTVMWIYPCVTLVGQGGRGRGGARGLVLLLVCFVVHNIKQKDKRLELDPHAKQTGHSARDDTVSVVRASPRDLRGDEVASLAQGWDRETRAIFLHARRACVLKRGPPC